MEIIKGLAKALGLVMFCVLIGGLIASLIIWLQTITHGTFLIFVGIAMIPFAIWGLYLLYKDIINEI